MLKSRSKDGSWGSTNNTLSAVEAFTDYLEWKREGDSNFELSILLDETLKSKTVFAPKSQDSTQKVTIPVADISKGSMHVIDFLKKNLNTLPNTFYYDMSLTYFLPITSIPSRDEGFAVERSFYKLDDTAFATPVREAKVGDVLKGVLRITVPKERRFMAVEDFIPAGMELVNFKLLTEDQSLRETGISDGLDRTNFSQKNLRGRGGFPELPDEVYSGNATRHERLMVDAEEVRDDRLFLFREWVREGVYEYEYFVRALVPGTFSHLPAVVSEMYFPENFGRTRGDYFTVTQP